ncbi:uncharacterized protein LOC126894919 [Daktulosphaira vitifoliae]|uniref:uncharacterized protein LOC126894919 n=1 Tax=Daktulosphaira vitifoliae TaxID=58002 RepID=UPI0021AA1460|nr:uncharacterized protein LOC126894919 [Daktulosphaira vitifoliae]XP_050522233.1 uncharacterized protein LOC126894919 [Daktulosphaira vitifoliae]
MHYGLQIILCVGLIFSTTAVLITDINIDIIKDLSFNNLQGAKNEFYKCAVNLDINAHIKKDIFNEFLTTLKDDIIFREIHPSETSIKILKFLNLNKFYNSEEFENCCTIFHSSLFKVEKPMFEESDDMNIVIYLRFAKSFDTMCDCLEYYNTTEKLIEDARLHDKPEPYSCREEYSQKKRQQYLREYTIYYLNKVISGDITPNEMVIEIKEYLHQYIDTDPFATYCSAVYYTSLISNVDDLKNLLKDIEIFKKTDGYIKQDFLISC